jgi:acetyl-CoA carboxylase carboxyltransferase component
VANQPKYLAGVLDCDSSDKAARFHQLLRRVQQPIITLEDLRDICGVDQEHAGVIVMEQNILYAYSEATVPKINCYHPKLTVGVTLR